ncbi:DUF397 domain-containing protein [Nonomuraea angiospora]|uniref:DUF397 domain-containing protein n=1 Tax=Nonomuraea angiospora TaxID=46172 RepID=UPI00341C6F3D
MPVGTRTFGSRVRPRHACRSATLPRSPRAAGLGTHIAVRHSLDPEGPVVRYTRSGWAAFMGWCP